MSFGLCRLPCGKERQTLLPRGLDFLLRSQGSEICEEKSRLNIWAFLIPVAANLPQSLKVLDQK